MQLPAALATLVTGRPFRVLRELLDFEVTASYARHGGTVRCCWRVCWRMSLFEILYCTVLYCGVVLYCTVGKARWGVAAKKEKEKSLVVSEGPQ